MGTSNSHHTGFILCEIGIQFSHRKFNRFNRNTRGGRGIEEFSTGELNHSVIGRFHTANAAGDDVAIGKSRETGTVNASSGVGILHKQVAARLVAHGHVTRQFEIGVFADLEL